MGVVGAFGSITGTTDAGLTAYFRADGCTEMAVADVLPILSKINYYTAEYVIGEMKIWDTGEEAIEPNNCAMVRVMVYADGWIAAWFDDETHSQGTTGGCGYVSAETLDNFGTFAEYPNKWNGCKLVVESSSPTDPECPDGTGFTIRSTDSANGRITVHADGYPSVTHFNTGYTYTVAVYQSSGNLVWWGHNSNNVASPPAQSNRLYRAIYELWEVLKGSSNAHKTYGATDKAYRYNDGNDTYTDDTTAFNDSGADDCLLLPLAESVNDAFYYGDQNTYYGIRLNIGQAGVGEGVVWEYWNGTSWATLSVTDGTNGFTVGGTNEITFDEPINWDTTSVNGVTLYWTRSRCVVASYTTTPIATQGWVANFVHSMDYDDTNLGMYSFEDTSAKYCLISGMSYAGGMGGISKYFYNTVLPTKTIHKHTINFGYRVYSSSSYANFSKISFMLNGHIIYEYDRAVSAPNIRTNGYYVHDITDIDGGVGVQNTFECYGYGHTSGAVHPAFYINQSSVLITS